MSVVGGKGGGLVGGAPLIPADGKREDGEDSELPRAHGTLGFSFTFALGDS